MEALKKKIKTIFIIYFTIIIPFLFINAILYHLFGVNFYAIAYLFFAFFNIIFLFNLLYLPFEVIQHFKKLYLNLTILFTFCVTFFYIKSTVYLLLWHFLITFGVYIFFQKKYFIKWVGVVLLLLVCNFIIIQFDDFFHFNQKYYKLPDETSYLYIYFTINSFSFTVSCIIILFILQNYYSKLNNIKSNTPDNALSNDGNDTTLFEQKIIIDNVHDDDNDEFNNLFEKIKNVVEKDKLFLDNELSINNIAKKVNTNISYISKAINIKTGENFNNFINQYRIHYFKELLKKKDNDSYKLKYLYSESGFKNQSTFNKAFKKIENKTPSEYIKMYFDRDVEFD
ncbi:hypothetical protein B0A58_10950 [Flavobacterium branchiophilum NBRC 15030 = ATCC 35035]|uniref:Helix-turn-helix protein n=1 Tax=Flavobacterium branchiophilum TaxID=55197 RepID=A0A543G1L6_9FLAO|nr:hypothetical protein B0A58_10950 [Flavobacterium branchiophilum NBRC 15030 = ATCC 35035]TQM39914.1 helix-turn-helix protein [Flavobacterium branchiophilum]